MVYFCADDYGISKESNSRIEKCIENGILNKISVLPNGELTGYKQRLAGSNTQLSLHINLVEGYPLSSPEEVNLLITDKGSFKYSFIGLFFLSLSPKRKEFEKQIYTEMKNQIRFWKQQVGEKASICIDSHQHVHMIPLIFKTLIRTIKDEEVNVSSLRIPAEPISPYLLTPSLYLTYNPINIIKQWVLKFFALLDRKALEKSGINYAYFMGILFSGKMDEKRINKALVHYLKIAEKNNRNVELAFHPGYLEKGEKPIPGSKESFGKFYFSPWRKVEYDTLINLQSKT